MKPTRDLVTDLLPLYFSGEASADTRALVEEFFIEDPEFERMARRLAGSLNTLKTTPDADEEMERRSLVRTRAELQSRNGSLGVAAAGIVAILVMSANHGERNSTLGILLPVITVACLAIYALLAKRTRKTGL